jgi:hypothetical protein
LSKLPSVESVVYVLIIKVQYLYSSQNCFAEKGKDLSAAIDSETKDDVQRLLLGLLQVGTAYRYPLF